MKRFILGLIALGCIITGSLMLATKTQSFGIGVVGLLLMINALMLWGVCGKHR